MIYGYCGACRKRAYYEERDAHEVKRRVKRRDKHKIKRGLLHVYRCPEGNGWHVGHDPAVNHEAAQ